MRRVFGLELVEGDRGFVCRGRRDEMDLSGRGVVKLVEACTMVRVDVRAIGQAS